MLGRCFGSVRQRPSSLRAASEAPRYHRLKHGASARRPVRQAMAAVVRGCRPHVRRTGARNGPEGSSLRLTSPHCLGDGRQPGRPVFQGDGCWARGCRPQGGRGRRTERT